MRSTGSISKPPNPATEAPDSDPQFSSKIQKVFLSLRATIRDIRLLALLSILRFSSNFWSANPRGWEVLLASLVFTVSLSQGKGQSTIVGLEPFRCVTLISMQTCVFRSPWAPPGGGHPHLCRERWAGHTQVSTCRTVRPQRFQALRDGSLVAGS